jgi:hypothetical protein
MVANPHHNDEDDEIDPDEDIGVVFLTPEEARDLFDNRARMELGISGEEFLRRWDAGEYTPIPDTPEGWKVGRLYMMFPFVGRSFS